VIVLDAGAMVEVLLGSASGLRIRERLRRHRLCVPQLIDLEVASVLRKLALHTVITTRRAGEALQDFQRVRLARYAHTPLLDRVWALRNNVTAYDAAYIALAESLSLPLITIDGPLARSSGHRARVETF
jgi:predicted nucleic acid-binding protein